MVWEGKKVPANDVRPVAIRRLIQYIRGLPVPNQQSPAHVCHLIAKRLDKVDGRSVGH